MKPFTMIAIAIFFMVSFSILALVSSGLRTAHALQVTRPNAGLLAAELSLTNKLVEESVSGDFGDMYPGYTWQRDNYLWPVMPTNGLFQVDFTVSRRVGYKPVETRMSILLFRPDSQIGGGLR